MKFSKGFHRVAGSLGLLLGLWVPDAKAADFEDVLELQSGREVRGKITEIHEEKGVTITTAEGESKHFAAWQIAKIRRHQPVKAAEPPVEKADPPEEAEKDDDGEEEDSPAAEDAAKGDAGKGVYGPGGVYLSGQVGWARSLGNDVGFGFSVGYRAPLGKTLALHVEGGFRSFVRKQRLTNVPALVDNRQTPAVLTVETIDNNSRANLFLLRPGLEMAFSPNVGLGFGVSLGSATLTLDPHGSTVGLQGNQSCPSASASSFAYGAHFWPVVVRPTADSNLEIAAGLEWLAIKAPRCERAVPTEEFTIAPGAQVEWPLVSREESASVFFATVDLSYHF